MSFEYEKYLKVIKPLPAPPITLELTPRAGMSWEEVEHMRELKRQAGEFEAWRSADMTLHKRSDSALNWSGGTHDILGLPNCGNDPSYP